MRDPVKRGFYLVTIGHCMECHTPMVRRRAADFENALGKGGEEFKGPWGVVGLAQHHLAQGKGHRRLDRRRDQGARSRKACAATARRSSRRWVIRCTPRMTDADLSAIVAYLRTVPPKE